MMIFQLSLLFALVLLNGLFAMSELAIVGARKTRLQARAENGSLGAKAALSLLEDSGRFLSSVSVGLTLIGVLVSTIGGDSFVEPLTGFFAAFPSLQGYSHVLALGSVVAVTSFCMVVLGELVPKRLALAHPESLAVALARFMTVFAEAARPLEWTLSLVTDGILRFLPQGETDSSPVTDAEINLMMRAGAASGEFHPEESAIVQMALRLGDRRVDSIMTPRTQVEWLDLKDSWEENKAKILGLGISRFPVVDGGPETVVGIVQIKGLLAQALAGEPVDLRKATHPPLFVPNTAPALRLLEMLKRSGEPMALVVDEYGDFDGLVTLHDIMQALVGDIAEPGVAEDEAIVQREDGSWLIDGLSPIETVTDRLKIGQLPGQDTGDFHTLGGFLMAQMKRVPRVPDHILVEGWRFEVMDMDGHRVDKVLVSRAAVDEAESP